VKEILSCREIVERTLAEAEAVIGRLATLRGAPSRRHDGVA
jgi:hypothetical protein